MGTHLLRSQLDRRIVREAPDDGRALGRLADHIDVALGRRVHQATAGQAASVAQVLEAQEAALGRQHGQARHVVLVPDHVRRGRGREHQRAGPLVEHRPVDVLGAATLQDADTPGVGELGFWSG